MHVFRVDREKEFSMSSIGVFKNEITKFGVGVYDKQYYMIGLKNTEFKAFKLKGI